MKVPFTVHAYDLDPTGRARPRALLDWMQEAAGIHAEALGVSMDRLVDAGLAWVLTRLWVRVDAWPGLHEAVEVETWPSETGQAMVRRDFVIRGRGGARIAAAASQWVVMRLETRRLGRLPEFIRAVPAQGERMLGETFPKPEAPASPVTGARFLARRDDLDRVGHVNNAVLGAWVAESAPEAVTRGRRLEELRLTFRHECVAGDAVRAEIEDTGTEVVRHRLVREADGAELVLARTHWV